MDSRGTHLKILNHLLTLPGNGVFTVHSGKEKKEKLIKKYYNTTNPHKARLKWEKSIQNLDVKVPWILGIPSDNGGGIQRGANWGPLAIREKLKFTESHFVDLGDVRVIPHLLHDKYLNEKTITNCQKAIYGKKNKLPVSPLSITEKLMDEIYKRYPHAKVLGLGGDHSVSYPLVHSWLNSRKNLSKAAILHFDAHTDLLEKRLGIDLCFGTWAFHVLDHLFSRNHLLQIGIRSSGKNKKYWKQETGVEQFWARDVLKWGTEKTYQHIFKYFKKLNIEEIYVSFDIDALDIKYASATGTPEKKGLLPPDCATLIRLLSNDFKITGADLVEVAPYVIPDNVNISDHKSSLKVAADLTQILLSVLKK
jgi:agmatinase